MMSRGSYRIVNLALALVLGFLLQFQVDRRIRASEIHYIIPPETEVPEWDADVYRSLFFGYWTAGVSWLWLQVLQEDAIFHIRQGTHPPSYYRLKLIAQLDPANFETYYFGANYLTVVRDDNVGAKDLLLLGEKFRTEGLRKYVQEFPEFKEKFWKGEWVVPMLLAYVYWFELGDIDSAATYFQRTGEIPEAPYYMKSLAEKMSTKKGQFDLAVKILGILIRTSSDPEVRKRYQTRFNRVSVQYFLFETNERFRKFLTSRGDYRQASEVHRERMEVYFEDFLRTRARRGRPVGKDPWGGDLSIDSSGVIRTTTLNRIEEI